MPFSCSGASKSFSTRLEKIQFFFFIMDHKSLHVRRSGDFLGLHSATLLLSHFAPTTMVFLQFLECTELMPASEFGSSPRPFPGPPPLPQTVTGFAPLFLPGRCQRGAPVGRTPGAVAVAVLRPTPAPPAPSCSHSRPRYSR